MAEATFSFDLHVLSTPPAFNLSQNQTLQLSQSSLPIRYSLVNEPEPAAVSSGVGLYTLFLIDCQELFFRFAIFFRGIISFHSSRRKVSYRLFDFHLSSIF